MHWYQMAADRGDPEAQTNLGYLYEIGSIGPENPGRPPNGIYELRPPVSLGRNSIWELFIFRGAGVERSEMKTHRALDQRSR